MAPAKDPVLSKAEALTTGAKFHYCGYYDKALMDPTSRYQLCC